MDHERPLHLGAAVPRADGDEKVRGQTIYAADHYGEDLLWIGVKRAGVPHTRIRGIHTARARALPGVVAVLTHQDVPGDDRQGTIRRDQPVLADDKARHVGDPLALVVAEDKVVLAAALALIELDLEPLPGVFDLEAALDEAAPRVHEDHAEGNVLLRAELTVGTPASARAECAAVVELTLDMPLRAHAYLETETGWARHEPDGTLTIICSTQTPFRDRKEVAEALGFDPSRVRVIAPYLGGGVGGKDGITVQSLLGLAAIHAGGRPVKLWYGREESFVAGVKRHAMRMRYRLGAMADGTLHYLDATLLLDGGPYANLGGVVLALGLEHGGSPYRIPHVARHGAAAYTNNPPGGPFRGFGVTQAAAALEQAVDLLADQLGQDRLALRRRNALERGGRNCVGKTLTASTGIGECLDAVARHPLWLSRERWKAGAPAGRRRGVGLAAISHGAGYGPLVPDTANAKLELTEDGRFRVYCGVADMGQGNAATYGQIAGAILGHDACHVELVQPDTERTLPSGSSSASRTTFTFGNALVGAAEALRQRLLARAADAPMACGPEELALVARAERARRGRRACHRRPRAKSSHRGVHSRPGEGGTGARRDRHRRPPRQGAALSWPAVSRARPTSGPGLRHCQPRRRLAARRGRRGRARAPRPGQCRAAGRHAAGGRDGPRRARLLLEGIRQPPRDRQPRLVLHPLGSASDRRAAGRRSALRPFAQRTGARGRLRLARDLHLCPRPPLQRDDIPWARPAARARVGRGDAPARRADFDISAPAFRPLNTNLAFVMFQAGFFVGPLVGGVLIAVFGYAGLFHGAALRLGLAAVALTGGAGTNRARSALAAAPRAE